MLRDLSSTNFSTDSYLIFLSMLRLSFFGSLREKCKSTFFFLGFIKNSSFLIKLGVSAFGIGIVTLYSDFFSKLLTFSIFSGDLCTDDSVAYIFASFLTLFRLESRLFSIEVLTYWRDSEKLYSFLESILYMTDCCFVVSSIAEIGDYKSWKFDLISSIFF